MTQFLKMLLLASTFTDDHSKWMVFYEWLNNDPAIDARWDMAIRTGDMIG